MVFEHSSVGEHTHDSKLKQDVACRDVLTTSAWYSARGPLTSLTMEGQLDSFPAGPGSVVARYPAVNLQTEEKMTASLGGKAELNFPSLWKEERRVEKDAPYGLGNGGGAPYTGAG